MKHSISKFRIFNSDGRELLCTTSYALFFHATMGSGVNPSNLDLPFQLQALTDQDEVLILNGKFIDDVSEQVGKDDLDHNHPYISGTVTLEELPHGEGFNVSPVDTE